MICLYTHKCVFTLSDVSSTFKVTIIKGEKIERIVIQHIWLGVSF